MAAQSQRPKLVAIVGPTASGKSELALRIAREFNGEIVAADSRTVYMGMDIGTAKPSKAEQLEIPHHLLNLIEPDQKFSVGQFKVLADQAINEIRMRGKLPILVGGTGLYIDSVIFDYKFNSRAEADPLNPRHRRHSFKDSKLVAGTLVVGLDPGKLELEKHIRQRVAKMLEVGFIAEVQKLSQKFPVGLEVFKTPGYGPFLKHLSGEISQAEAVEQFTRADLKLAKRQRTWFRRNPHINWFENVSEAYNFLARNLA